jgi:hypothetical protein
VADASSGTVHGFNLSAGQAGSAIAVGPNLTSLSITPDGHYLVLGSSDAAHALYAVDLFKVELGQADQAVKGIAVPGGVLAVATGAEITVAYATTGSGALVYCDLGAGLVSRSIQVGHHPVSLSLGLRAAPLGG